MSLKGSSSVVVRGYLVYYTIIGPVYRSLRIIIARELEGNRRDHNIVEKQRSAA